MNRFAVFATQRSGTGLLSSVVSRHDKVHLYNEVFLDQGYHSETNFHNFFLKKLREDPANILLKKRKPLMKEFLLGIMDRGEYAVGINIKYDQVPHFPMLLELLKEMDFKVVHLVRRNLLKTHVSSLLNQMAGKLGRRAHGTKELDPCKVTLDPAGVANALERRHAEIVGFAKELGASFPYLELSFEDFFQNGERSVSTISSKVLRSFFDFIGVDYDESMEMKTELKKTNPTRLRNIVANYDEVRAALGKGKWRMLLEEPGEPGEEVRAIDPGKVREISEVVAGVNSEAEALLRQGQYKPALGILSRSLQMMPYNAETLMLSGDCMAGMGKPEEALGCFMRATEQEACACIRSYTESRMAALARNREEARVRLLGHMAYCNNRDCNHRMISMLKIFGEDAPADAKLPDFIGIGAQKAGTVWLFKNLIAHPQIFIPQWKECHHFDSAYWPDADLYSMNFMGWNGGITGDITPAYAILDEERVRFMSSLMPEAKILFMVRNPIDRAWSQARMRFYRLMKDEFPNPTDDDFFEYFSSRPSFSRSDYGATLRVFKKYFPAENIRVLFFEDLVSKPEELLNGVFEFLGANTIEDFSGFPLRKKFNSEKKKALPVRYRQYLFELYEPIAPSIIDQIGERARPWFEQNDE